MAEYTQAQAAQWRYERQLLRDALVDVLSGEVRIDPVVIARANAALNATNDEEQVSVLCRCGASAVWFADEDQQSVLTARGWLWSEAYQRACCPACGTKGEA